MAPKQIVAICQNALKGHEGSKEVISVISKKVPTKTVWPVVMDLWKSVQTEASTVGHAQLASSGADR
jgi:U3 small nucleolar RNA-associated protein 10